MNTFISMLRGINVSGHNNISMPDMKNLYESLGFQNVVTYVQSGNVIFDTTKQDPSRLSSLIELQIKKSFNLSVPVIIRNKNEFKLIITRNPFVKRKEDLIKLYVTFLQSSPVPSDLNKLIVPPLVTDQLIIQNKEIFLFCPNGYGKTKLNNNFFEKKLNIIATTRNWNTITTLFKLTSERILSR
jgi:uncharacterized protein (DUF1697 family)